MSKPQRDETPPAWLKDTFIENILRKRLKNPELKVVNSEIRMATAVGDHYGSLMFRIILTVRKRKGSIKEKFSIIAKCMPSGLMGKELRKLSAFEKETQAYINVLPAIHELLKQAYPNHRKLWPECYYTQGAPDNALILEDLRENNFEMASRMEGLDMDHTVLVLRSLAKFHAAALVLRKRNPEYFGLYESVFWNPSNTDTVKNMFTTPFKVMPNEMKNWEDFDKKALYMKKLKKVGENVLDRVFETWKRDNSKLNLLLHGDCWVNNFMFKYDKTRKLTMMNFLDFQLMNVNSPALDLQFLIFTSASSSIKFDYIESFLRIYHDSFSETLKKLGHESEKPYGLQDVRNDFEEKNFWGFTVLYTVFPLFMSRREDACHPDEFFKTDGDIGFKNMYKNPTTRQVLIRGFQYFEEKGIF